MPQIFYKRLRAYYLKVAEVLRGEADAASVFPNSSDIGGSRERIYAAFLRQHAPSKCNVFLGGFLFHRDGTESRQLDVIITTDTAPRYDFHNPDGQGKSFSPVEGTLGVASIKSTLDRAQLFDALEGIASIPPTEDLGQRAPPGLPVPNYSDWPYKIIYATNGIGVATLLQHLHAFYESNAGIPLSRRPNMIHVAGRYAIFRTVEGMSISSRYNDAVIQPEVGEFRVMSTDCDLQAIIWALDELQKRAMFSTHILFSYSDMINRINSAT